MARRVRYDENDYCTQDADYGDEYGGYGDEDDAYEQALRESKKDKKKKAKAKKQGVPETDIDELMAMFEEGSFTREQVKGYLENYRQFDDGKEQAIAQMRYKKAEMDKKGKKNKKVEIQAKIEQQA